MPITVMICFARSGGTVLNKCLGVLPGVVMMSEVNPRGGGSGAGLELRTVKEQAREWYGIDLKSEGFTENVLELYDYCNKNDKHLILRDWPFIDFYPSQSNGRETTYRFSLLEELKDKVELKTFAFVRDSIDAWISLGTKKPKKYFPHYRKYAEGLIDEKIPYFKYEDFCLEPEKVMKEICSYAGVEYSDSFKNFDSFKTVNGDTQITDGSRGVNQRVIKPLLRKRAMLKRIFQLSKNKDMIDSNKLFGYSSNYYSVELEKFDLKKAVKRFFRSFRI